MNKDILKGQWTQVKGKVKEKWGDLTDNDLTQIEGHRDQLVGRIQERYGLRQEEAEKQVKDFELQHLNPNHQSSQEKVA